MSLSTKQLAQVTRIGDAIDTGPVALLEYLKEREDAFDEKVKEIMIEFENKVAEVKASVPDLNKILNSIRGKDGDKPIAGVDYPIPENGKNGDNYVVTQADYKKIAKEVKVPIVEKKVIVEKTETIIEQPIIKTEIIKETTVDKTDTPFDILAKINELPVEPDFQIDASHVKNLPKPFLGTIGGGRVGLQVRSNGTKVGTKSNEVNFKTGFTVTLVNGVPTITTSTGLSVLTTASTINDSNVTFVFASEPTLVVVNGTSYRKGHGWTGTATVTLDSPVGSIGDIYALG